MIVGVLSDTHGSLHPRLMPAFQEAGVELILHAGDVGKLRVLDQLQQLAPVIAVRGNIDDGGELSHLPEEERFTKGGVDVYITHIGAKPNMWLRGLPQPRPHVAICGHSHIPLLERAQGVLFLNPGAAGIQARFGQPPTAAILTLSEGSASAEVLEL